MSESSPITKQAVLIGDICGSTALYEKIGDDPARQRIEKGIATMIGEIAAFQGQLVNNIGDQILCTFPNSELALLAACAMQRAVKDCKFEDNSRIQVRIGLHYGDVIVENDAAFGDAVNVTARVAAIANADQIMTTQAVYSALPAELKEKTFQFMRAGLKGKMNPYDIFFVSWEQDDLSATCFNVPAPYKSQENTEELSLFYCGRIFKVNSEHKVVTIGRGDKCDIIVKNQYASRQHLHLGLRTDKFYIADHSINGTFIRFNDNKIIRLVREEIVLQGSGVICLGHDDFGCTNDLIQFLITPGNLV